MNQLLVPIGRDGSSARYLILFLRAASLLTAVLWISSADAQAASTLKREESPCGPVAIPGHYGPYDYISEQHRLAIVDRAHFTPQVEQLQKGVTGPLGGDLSYTLNASPNHHRALDAASRLARREGTDTPRHFQLSVSCYFDRAIRFRPRDTIVRSLYALHLLHFLKRREDALAQVDAVVMFAQDNPMSHYNAGLLYLEMGEATKAAEQAQRAQELGDPRVDLINRLKAQSQWPPESLRRP